MNTAVIITGQARSFRFCQGAFEWFILRRLPNPHIFVSVEDDENADGLLKLRKNWPVFFEKTVTPEIAAPAQEGERAFSGQGKNTPALLRQFCALERGYAFFLESAAGGGGFDLVVRARPDLWWQNFLPPTLEAIATHHCWTPWWGTFGGVNDRMAIMGPAAAGGYFRTFSKREHLWSVGCPLHPEQMLLASLEDAHVHVVPRLLAEFRTLRLPVPPERHGSLAAEPLCPYELAALLLSSR